MKTVQTSFFILLKSSQDSIRKRLKDVKLSCKSNTIPKELPKSSQDNIISRLNNMKLSCKTASISKELLPRISSQNGLKA